MISIVIESEPQRAMVMKYLTDECGIPCSSAYVRLQGLNVFKYRCFVTVTPILIICNAVIPEDSVCYEYKDLCLWKLAVRKYIKKRSPRLMPHNKRYYI